jgi:hypothetical protein
LTKLAELSSRAKDTSDEPLTVEEVQFWLEWAGTTLLSLRSPSALPKNPGSAWPAYNYEFAEAYGYTGERLRAAIPSSTDIQLMDIILPLTGIVQDVTCRRILSARALITPVSHRYLYSWSRLAFMLHSDYRRVMRQHRKGLQSLVEGLPQAKIDIVRFLVRLYNVRP